MMHGQRNIKKKIIIQLIGNKLNKNILLCWTENIYIYYCFKYLCFFKY